jgi:hypothetical protein
MLFLLELLWIIWGNYGNWWSLGKGRGSWGMLGIRKIMGNKNRLGLSYGTKIGIILI